MIIKVKRLNVKYNDKLVGYLVDLEDGRTAFQYDEEWVKTGFSISPFSLPLNNKVFINSKMNFGGLYGVFNDSLPDGWGELLVRRMLIKKGINPNDLTPLQKLAIVSKNGLGGLSYEPSQIISDSKEKDIDLDQLSKEVNEILNNDEDSNQNLDEIYNLGGSSGGARPKAHLMIDGEEWIIKFPCLYDPKNIGELEYKSNNIAKECAINLPEYKLFESNICPGYFGTKRFDRNGGKRLHMISLCALLETSHRVLNLDYYHLFQVIKMICTNKEDLYEAFKIMCFNVLYGNKDDHGKNFSFIYDESLRSYKLSPAYDLTKTENKLEHEMTVNGNGNPSIEDLLAIARDMHLSIERCESIINKTKETIAKKS